MCGVVIGLTMWADLLRLYVLLILVSFTCQNQSDPHIWNYFLTKYSNDPSRRYLTPHEISKIVQENQGNSSLLTTENGNCSCLFPRAPVISNCEESLLPSSPIRSLTSACPKILYLIDNPNCSAKILTDGSELEDDGNETPPKPSSGEGNNASLFILYFSNENEYFILNNFFCLWF